MNHIMAVLSIFWISLWATFCTDWLFWWLRR